MTNIVAFSFGIVQQSVGTQLQKSGISNLILFRLARQCGHLHEIGSVILLQEETPSASVDPFYAILLLLKLLVDNLYSLLETINAIMLNFRF